MRKVFETLNLGSNPSGGTLVICFGLCISLVDSHLGTMEVVRSIRTIGSFVIYIVTNPVKNVK